MAKKNPPEQQDLIPDVSEIPAPLKRAVTQYKNASVEKSRAEEKRKAKKDNVLALMAEHGIEAVPVTVDGVKKIIRHVVKDDLKETVAKDPSDAPEAGE